MEGYNKMRLLHTRATSLEDNIGLLAPTRRQETAGGLGIDQRVPFEAFSVENG